MDQNSEIIQAPAATVGDQAGQAETSEQPFSLSEGIDLEVFTGAAEGQIEEIRKHRDRLHLILTPTKNTVLHICIAYATKLTLTKFEKARRSITPAIISLLIPTSSPTSKKSTDFVSQLLEMCPLLLLQPNDSGDTALHIAARTGHAGIVEALIKAVKGDLERQVKDAWKMLRTPNKERNTALHEAARFNHLDVVKILTREDPDFLHSTNVAGETPIYLAAERGYRNLVFKILDTCTHPTYGGYSTWSNSFARCSDQRR
ncbi:hypothetical protein M0R45_005847 [Rubus argutus]|uniref:Uncharacterized protein n=1 Tax=Rubus argutus TaxID=59490 RepID=A0AAW1YNS1_RUBAR